MNPRVEDLQRILGQKQVAIALLFQNRDLYYFAGTMQDGVLTVPATNQERLAAILGERYPELVGEDLKLSPKSGFRRLIFEPGPGERNVSDALRDVVTVREQLSFTFKQSA